MIRAVPIWIGFFAWAVLMFVLALCLQYVAPENTDMPAGAFYVTTMLYGLGWMRAGYEIGKEQGDE